MNIQEPITVGQQTLQYFNRGNQEDNLSLKKVGHKSETMINFYRRLHGKKNKSTSLSPYRQQQTMENNPSSNN